MLQLHQLKAQPRHIAMMAQCTYLDVKSLITPVVVLYVSASWKIDAIPAVSVERIVYLTQSVN